MTAIRPLLLAAALFPLALAGTARAAASDSRPAAEAGSAPSAPARAGHEGISFAAPAGARARIVDDEGRTVSHDAGEDLIAPTALSAGRARAAIAEMIRAADPARRAAAATPLAPARPQPRAARPTA